MVINNHITDVDIFRCGLDGEYFVGDENDTFFYNLGVETTNILNNSSFVKKVVRR